MRRSKEDLASESQIGFYKGVALELAVALILSFEGYRIRGLGQKLDSEEIDIICEKGIGPSLRVLVCECKNVHRLIEYNDVDKLIERLRKVKDSLYSNLTAPIEGRFYTTSNFDQMAKDLALSVRKFTVKLINGKKLKRLFAESGLKFPD